VKEEGYLKWHLFIIIIKNLAIMKPRSCKVFNCWNIAGNYIYHYIKSKIKVSKIFDIAILGAGESGTGAALLAQKKGLNVWFLTKDSYMKNIQERS
jgi:hypothetical protein